MPPERAAQAVSGLWTWLTQQAKPVFRTASRGPVIQLCRFALSQASVPGGTRLHVHTHPRLCLLLCQVARCSNERYVALHRTLAVPSIVTDS